LCIDDKIYDKKLLYVDEKIQDRYQDQDEDLLQDERWKIYDQDLLYDERWKIFDQDLLCVDDKIHGQDLLYDEKWKTKDLWSRFIVCWW
jgi:hypothetical protein